MTKGEERERESWWFLFFERINKRTTEKNKKEGRGDSALGSCPWRRSFFFSFFLFHFLFPRLVHEIL